MPLEGVATMDQHYVKNIEKSFDGLHVLKDISIHFIKGHITCILGPSGCGKSTLLNIISGIIKDYKGEVVGFNKEKVSFVFQEDRLIPWLSVYDNMKFVLKDKYPKDKINQKILTYLSLVGMNDYINFYPADLSGGMKQRVAIARALAYGGQIMIMDEPFKSLDIKNKMQLLADFKRICKQTHSTAIFVTHDIDEALEIGDDIYILSDKPSQVKSVWKDLKIANLRKQILLELIK